MTENRQLLAKEHEARAFREKKIRLRVNDEQELYKKFSLNDEVNPEIIDYLESEVDGVSLFADITIEVVLKEKSEKNLAHIESLVKEETAKRAENIDITLAKIKRQSIMLAFGGFLPLAVSQILSTMAARFMVKEFFLIIAWVFIWKAVELFFFNRPELVKRKIRLKKIFRAEFLLFPD